MVLKFGRGGTPHERLIRITGNLRFLYWEAGWFCRKLGQKCTLDLERVTRIMTGQSTVPFQRWQARYGFADSKSLSFIYVQENGQETSFDIVLSSQESFEFWVTSMNYIIKQIKARREKMTIDELRLESHWRRADSDHSGTLTTAEVIRLIGSLNISMPQEIVLKTFRIVDADKNNSLDFYEFIKLMDLLLVRTELIQLWSSITSGEGISNEIQELTMDPNNIASKKATVTVSEFLTFWESFQGETLNMQILEKIVKESLTEGPAAVSTSSLDIDATPFTFTMFSKLVCHNINEIFEPTKTVVYQDMTKPLSYYYIESSHNTYLEGDQLASNSSVNRYVKDLLSGVRCVELDCWDGGDNEPCITHGHTLTGKILFREVIKAIKEYGFVNSVYPVILSIENHCGLIQQRILAEIMIDILGDLIARPRDYPDGYLPSPETLKNKVIIKGKRLADTVNDSDDDDDEDEDDDEDTEEDIKEKEKKVGMMGSMKNMINKAKTSSKKVSIDTELSKLTFLGTGKVKKFDAESNALAPDMMCSYSETKTAKYLRDSTTTAGWINHNRKHMSRIYPKGTRIDSSNYDPIPSWAAGNQLVALNYQTLDQNTQLSYGKFRENGKSGYLLKPEYMIQDNGYKSPAIQLQIHIISGLQLPKPGNVTEGEIIDPFVILKIHGIGSDNVEQKTKSVNDNGFNPIWNEVIQLQLHLISCFIHFLLFTIGFYIYYCPS